MKFYFNDNVMAGVLCFTFGKFAIQFLIKKKHWIYGYKEYYYNGQIKIIGFGPFLSICYDDGVMT